MGFDWQISIQFVSLIEGSLIVVVVMIDGGENAVVSWVLNFRVRVLLKDAVILVAI